MLHKLDHLGLVVDSISEFANIFRSIGFSEITSPQPDPIQKVSACFIQISREPNIYIELLEPTHDDSPVTNFLKKKRGGFHHICFEVENIGAVSNTLKEKGIQMICPPVDCIGYDRSFKRGCKNASKIAFFLISNKVLMELIEKGQ